MKLVRILALILVLVLLVVPSAFAAVDLSGMSYDELVALKDQINLAIWNSQEWQEVTVPQGVWKVGEDIPTGHWTIKTEANSSSITICTKLDETGKDADYSKTKFLHFEQIHSPDGMFFDEKSDKTEVDLELKEGTYVIIEYGNAIFTPYTGKPTLGFK